MKSTAIFIASLCIFLSGCGGGSGDDQIAPVDPNVTPGFVTQPPVTQEPQGPVTPEPPITVTPEPPVTVTPEPPITVTPEPPVTVTPEPPITVTPEPPVTVTPEPPIVVAPVQPEPTVSTLPDLVGVTSIESSIAQGETITFQASEITGLILVSNTGDTDIIIRDQAGNVACQSFSIRIQEVCPNADFSNALSLDETYEVSLFGFTDSDFQVFSVDTPFLTNRSTFDGFVAEGELELFISNQITAATLLSLTGDADLAIYDMDFNLVCDSFNEGLFDGCNNIDGNLITSISSDELYVVAVDGFTSADYTLDTFNAVDTLESNGNNFVFEVPINENEIITYSGQNISEISLFTLSGDADLVVREISSGQVVCSSLASGLDPDFCTVNLGNYLIEVSGFRASLFDLVVQ